MTGDAEDAQNRFDLTLDRVRREGVAAYRRGVPRTDNPYRDHPEPHLSNAWIGGMAETALGIADEEGHLPSPTP